MKSEHILSYRLKNQLLHASKFKTPEEVVSWMGAMQAQEYAMAKWAIALRMKTNATEDIVEAAFQKGKIIRTHLMRPTWHFTSPEYLRDLLELTAPHVHKLNAYYYKQTELDKNVFKKCHKVFINALRDGEHLTREELKEQLADIGIVGDGVRLAYIFMEAELEQLICSGPRKGKQFTYSLIDEWVPSTPKRSRDEIRSWFTEKYFESRGPATAQDFAYWSGLSITEVKRGIESLSSKIEAEKSDDGRMYYYIPSRMPKDIQATFLMPDYDEYGMSYKERSMIADLQGYKATGFEKWLVVDGKIRGRWTKATKGKMHNITTKPFGSLTTEQKTAVKKAVERFEKFQG